MRLMRETISDSGLSGLRISGFSRSLALIFILLAAGLIYSACGSGTLKAELDTVSLQDISGREKYLQRENGGVPIPANGAYWGTFREPSYLSGRAGDKRAEMIRAECQIGRNYAIDRQFYRWGQVLPSDYDKWTAEQGRIPMISIAARKKSDGSIIKWADIAVGREDGYIIQLADNLKAWGKSAFFIFHHEPDHDTALFGSTADYRAAWKHIRSVFDSKGVRNLSYTWVMMPYVFKTNPGRAAEFYPGDDVIDWIASDPYNSFKNGNWYSLAHQIQAWYDWATMYKTGERNKPLALAEWGSKEDPADPMRKANWFKEALGDAQARFPAIKAYVYFDANKLNDWRIDTSRGSLEAFIEMGRHGFFGQASVEKKCEVDAAPAGSGSGQMESYRTRPNRIPYLLQGESR